MPNEVEFAAVESFIKILKPLVEITETVGCSSKERIDHCKTEEPAIENPLEWWKK